MRGVAVLTLTGVLSQVVGFVYRILLTRLAGGRDSGAVSTDPAGVLGAALLDLGGAHHGGLQPVPPGTRPWGTNGSVDQVRGQAVKLFLLLALVPCGLLLLFSDGVSVYLLGDARTRLG